MLNSINVNIKIVSMATCGKFAVTVRDNEHLHSASLLLPWVSFVSPHVSYKFQSIKAFACQNAPALQESLDICLITDLIQLFLHSRSTIQKIYF